MKRWRRSLHFLEECNHLLRNFRRAISLHGHTQHSRESLGFISHYLSTVPIVTQIARHAMDRYRRDHGEELDFNRAHWTAPLTAEEAYRSERRQIEESLGLEASVSLTDHDNIDAGMDWRGEGQAPPISLEWTVPYGPAYFHLGIHNLPRSQAHGVLARLSAYTQSPDERQLHALLAGLDGMPEVLIVFNHPFWEMEGIGHAALHEMLNSFIRAYGQYVHALEVSGLRPWHENEQALQLAKDLGMAVVSGGDRHGWSPNAILNVTRAGNFSEFVAEVRQDGRSEMVVMPSYQNEPFGLRMMQVAWDVLREYPEHPCGRMHWTDRVFFRCDDGVTRPLTRCFRGGEPTELRFLTAAMRQLEWQPWRALLHAAWGQHSSNRTAPSRRPSFRPAARPAFTSRERSAA